MDCLTDDSYSKQIRRCTVSSSNGVTKTQVYYPRPRSFSAGSQNSTLVSNKRLSAPVTSTTTPTPAVKVMRIGSSAKMYGKAKSLEEGGNRKMASSGTACTSNSTMRYKTELCRPFQENGFCKYGDKCQFAHGEQDLRSLPRHPKYKTELCRTYHTRGFCPYGSRCHFIHSIEETRPSQDGLASSSSSSSSSSSGGSGGSVPKSPTKRTFSFSAVTTAVGTPLSPSLDSGISSPDDFQRSRYFEFPVMTDHNNSGSSGSDGDYRDFEQSFEQDVNYVPQYSTQESIPDPFDPDLLSIGSDSPSKPLTEEFSSDLYSMQDLLAQMSMEDSSCRTSSCHRLPVFDDMLNTKSDTALLDMTSHNPGFFKAA